MKYFSTLAIIMLLCSLGFALSFVSAAEAAPKKDVRKTGDDRALVVADLVPAQSAAQSPPQSATPAGRPQDLPLRDPVTDMEFVSVPEGCFTPGRTQVCLDAFKIGKYEVTQGQYKRIMGSNPSNFSSCGDDCPVEQVSWNDVQEFLQKLNRETGRTGQTSRMYRLPTEAEWQYACTSGGKNEEYCGGNDVNAVAWYNNNSGSQTHRVGQKQPNGLGIYDMSGNVWEWGSDWYGDSYPTASRNPTGASSGSYRVLRGGAWINGVSGVRASYRYRISPDTRNRYLGFRLVSPVQ